MADRKKNGQFEKGRSGNPRGRPKKQADRAEMPHHVREIVKQVGEEVISLRSSDGGTVEMSSIRAVLIALRTKALNGSIQAQRAFLALTQKNVEAISRYRRVIELLEDWVKDLQEENARLREQIPRKQTHGVVVKLPDGRCVPSALTDAYNRLHEVSSVDGDLLAEELSQAPSGV